MWMHPIGPSLSISVERDETGQNGGSQSVQRERFTGEIDDEEAKELLRRDIFAEEDAVPRLIHVPLTDGQFDALIPFTFDSAEEQCGDPRLGGAVPADRGSCTGSEPLGNPEAGALGISPGGIQRTRRTLVSADERGMANGIRRKAETDQIYRHIRSEIQYEYSLMNARVNWLIASQAFLFVPLAIGVDPRQPPRSIAHSLLFPFIPYLGLALCVLALIGIVAAVWRVENWRRKMARGGYGGDGEHDTFSIIQPNQPVVVILGYCSAVGIPLVLAAAWVILRFFPPTLA